MGPPRLYNSECRNFEEKTDAQSEVDMLLGTATSVIRVALVSWP
jgi:hypothetical protein